MHLIKERHMSFSHLIAGLCWFLFIFLIFSVLYHLLVTVIILWQRFINCRGKWPSLEFIILLRYSAYALELQHSDVSEKIFSPSQNSNNSRMSIFKLYLLSACSAFLDGLLIFLQLRNARLLVVFDWLCSNCTWSRCVGLCVSRGAGGWGLSRRLDLDDGLFPLF